MALRLVCPWLRGKPQPRSCYPLHTHRRALTRIDVLVVLGIALLLAIVFVLTFPRAREICTPRRCASNLRSAGLGMVAYGNENDDYWPIPPHAPAVEEARGRVTYAPGKIGMHNEKADDPTGRRRREHDSNASPPSASWPTTENDTEISPTLPLWMLVRIGVESPKELICPVSTDERYVVDYPEDVWDVESWEQISYGYQVPFGKHGQPHSDRPQEMPLAADKGPYGAALETGRAHPGVPTASSQDKPKAWRPWNSPNHSYEGQNVLYADGHVEWHFTPLAGVHNDNIYTRWSDASGGTAADETPRIHGTPPTSNETPWSDTDTLIYP